MKSFLSVLQSAVNRIDNYPLYRMRQIFRCAHCSSLQTIEEINKFYTVGVCEDCAQFTDIWENGMDLSIGMGPEKERPVPLQVIVYKTTHGQPVLNAINAVMGVGK